MAGKFAETVSPGGSASAPRSIWLTIEADEIIELKRVALDQDSAGALDLFRRVVAPQVRARAQRFGLLPEDLGQGEVDDHLSR